MEYLNILQKSIILLLTKTDTSGLWQIKEFQAGNLAS